MYLIENAISLGISHHDCNWTLREKYAWIKNLLSLKWVNEAAQYALSSGNDYILYKYISNQNKMALLLLCILLRWKNKY